MYKQNPHRMKDLGLITETLVRSGFEHLTDWSSDKSHQKKGVSNQVVQATKKKSSDWETTMSFLKKISPLLKNTFLSEKDVLSICAAQIEAEIQQVWYYFDNTLIFYSSKHP